MARSALLSHLSDQLPHLHFQPVQRKITDANITFDFYFSSNSSQAQNVTIYDNLLDLLNLELNNAIFLRNIVNWNGITSILYSVNLKRLLQTERWYYYLFILYSCVDVDTPIFNIISSPLLKSPIISINQFERLEAARCESYLVCFNLFFLVALLSEPYFVPSLTAYYTDITSRTEVIAKKRGSS